MLVQNTGKKIETRNTHPNQEHPQNENAIILMHQHTWPCVLVSNIEYCFPLLFHHFPTNQLHNVSKYCARCWFPCAYVCVILLRSCELWQIIFITAFFPFKKRTRNLCTLIFWHLIKTMHLKKRFHYKKK